jgi:aspartate/methionine/tyrosine aminotransferase
MNSQTGKPLPTDIAPFHAITISRLAHQIADAGGSVIHMEFGQPSTGAPRPAIAAARRVLDSDPMGYWESVPLRERIAVHYRDTQGVEIDAARIILTCGASPALVLALLTAFNPGDRVALARPGYVAYRNTLRSLGMEAVEMECGAEVRFQLTAAAIAALDPAPQGVIIASPANPTGTIIAPEELARIAAICAERNIRLISDEVYHGLSYIERAQSILRYTDDPFVLNSFSKYFSMAGWRLGWLVTPHPLIGAARARISNLFLNPPSLSQHAALAAFDGIGELEGHLQTYSRNRALLLEALPTLGFTQIAPPDGAFYIYASVAHLTDDSLGFCEKLLRETGLATAPGIDFDPVGGHHFIRLSFAVSTTLVQQAIERLADWLPRQPLRAG